MIILTFVRCYYKLMFNLNAKTLEKGERLQYGESMMTHAMVRTAINEKQVSPTSHTYMCIVYSSQILHFTIQILLSFQAIHLSSSNIQKCWLLYVFGVFGVLCTLIQRVFRLVYRVIKEESTSLHTSSLFCSNII